MKIGTDRTLDAQGLIFVGLQTFADDPEAPEALAGEAATTDEDPTAKTYTQEELDKLLQAESDRRVQQALKTQREKLAEEVKSQIEKERREAERLAQLSAEEKAKELQAQKEREISEKEKMIQRRELLMDTIDLLQDRGLPRAFAEMLMGNDGEETLKRVNAFQEQYKQDLEKTVAEKLKSGFKPEKGAAADPAAELEAQLAKETDLARKLMLRRKLDELKKGD